MTSKIIKNIPIEMDVYNEFKLFAVGYRNYSFALRNLLLMSKNPAPENINKTHTTDENGKHSFVSVPEQNKDVLKDHYPEEADPVAEATLKTDEIKRMRFCKHIYGSEWQTHYAKMDYVDAEKSEEQAELNRIIIPEKA